MTPRLRIVVVTAGQPSEADPSVTIWSGSSFIVASRSSRTTSTAERTRPVQSATRPTEASAGRVFDVSDMALLAVCASCGSGESENRREAAKYQALAVEGHGADLAHARVGHHLLGAFVAHGLRRPFEPGQDDALVRLGLHGAVEIRVFAFRHVVAPALDHAGCAVLLHQRPHLARMREVGVLVAGVNGDDVSIEIHFVLLGF